MTNPLIEAAYQQTYDSKLIAQASTSQINSATRWAAQHDKLSILNDLRPHSKYKTTGGLQPLLCLAVEYGSGDILQTYRNQVSKEIIMARDCAIIKQALKSETTVGLQWLIKNRQAFGLTNDHFAHLLETVSDQACCNVVEMLAQQFPSQRFEWLRMVENCAHHHDVERCLLYLNKTHQHRTETPKQMGRALNAVVEHIAPNDFNSIFLCVENLWRQDLETIIHIPRLFQTALNRTTQETQAVVALIKYFGNHVDCKSLGAQCLERIEEHKALHLKQIISQSVDLENNTPFKPRKI